MESDVTHSADFYKAWAWFEKNKRQVMIGAVVVLLVGIVVGFILWQRAEKTANAGRALTAAVFAEMNKQGATPPSAEPFLKVANDYPGMSAGAKALLLAAGALFEAGKYDAALAQFQKFARDHRDSPFFGQALLGVAACYDAQGKTTEALTAYKNLVSQHPNDPVVPQAKFALARLYEAQKQPEQAHRLLEEISASDPFGLMSSEARTRVRELEIKYPNLATAKPAAAPASVVIPSLTNRPGTNPATAGTNTASPAATTNAAGKK